MKIWMNWRELSSEQLLWYMGLVLLVRRLPISRHNRFAAMSQFIFAFYFGG